MYSDGQKRGRAFSLYQSNRRNQNNICDQPCVFTNMYFGPPVKVIHKAKQSQDGLFRLVLSLKGATDPGDDTGQMVLYFRRNVKVTN